VRPGYVWEDGFEKRALPPSPPKIKSSRSTKPKANLPVKSSARENSKEAEDDGIDEIPSVPKKQQEFRTTGDREAADDIDGDQVALTAENSDSEVPAQTTIPSKKRKILHPNPIGDAEGRSHIQVPVTATSVDDRVDEQDEPTQRPNKKGKKGRKVA